MSDQVEPHAVPPWLTGSAQRQRGPDHPHQLWQPLPARALRRWPNGAGVAVCPVLALDSHEDEVPADWPQPQWAPGGVGLRPDPNIARIGARDYGLRRGFERLARGLAQHHIAYALAMDVLSAETRPDLVAAALQGHCGRIEWVAHGLSWNRPLHAGLSTAQELAYLHETRFRLAACGIHSDTWLGIEYGQSPRTPALLAQAGYRIGLDWCNDEQPSRFNAASPGAGAPERPEFGGRTCNSHTEHQRSSPVLWSLPQMADLDDGFALCSPRGVSVQAYAQRLVDAGTALAAEGRSQARVMVFTLRPFLSGQPFRATAILNALVRLQATPGVWLATPQDIVNAWLQAEASGASEPSVAGSPARPASAEELSTKATP